MVIPGLTDLDTIYITMRGNLIYTSIEFMSYPRWPWGGIVTTMYRIDDIEIAERPRGLNGLMICALRNYVLMVRCWPWGGVTTTEEYR